MAILQREQLILSITSNTSQGNNFYRHFPLPTVQVYRVCHKYPLQFKIRLVLCRMKRSIVRYVELVSHKPVGQTDCKIDPPTFWRTLRWHWIKTEVWSRPYYDIKGQDGSVDYRTLCACWKIQLGLTNYHTSNFWITATLHTFFFTVRQKENHKRLLVNLVK